MSVFGLLLPIWICFFALASFCLTRKISKHWTMTQRREAILLEYYQSMQEHFVEGIRGDGTVSLQDAIEVFSVCSVRMADECWNQMRHLEGWRGRLWPQVPDVGESWPDFEPAPFESVPDAEGDH